MPELPEIETLKRGIIQLEHQLILKVIVRNPNLRYKINPHINELLQQKTICKIERRAKYLIITLSQGILIIHLGMSGSLTLVNNDVPIKKHDHVDIIFSNGVILRYNDPRRFGSILYTDEPFHKHQLIKNLGPEPLDGEFNPSYLFKQIQTKQTAIKQLIMDNHIVVGVGNIYACESLFLAGILPTRPGNSITFNEAKILVESIKKVLKLAIKLGGSSLRDYKKSDGTLGYFQTIHNVYGMNDQPCKTCGTIISSKRIGQRNSFYCLKCQK